MFFDRREKKYFRKPTQLFQNLFQVVRNILEMKKLRCNNFFRKNTTVQNPLIIAMIEGPCKINLALLSC